MDHENSEPSPSRRNTRTPDRQRQQQQQNAAQDNARSSTPTSFEFVASSDRSAIRSHAMRESWRQRNLRSGSGTWPQGGVEQPQDLPPALVHRQVSSRSFESPASSSEGNSDSEDEDDRLLPRERIFVDLRHAVQPSSRPGGVPRWKVCKPPRMRCTKNSPRQTLNLSNAIDPFNCLRLDKEDQELLFHWVNSYASEAFGQPTDPIFNPIRELYIPVDLSHTAATHALLAHSASHMAYLRRERTSVRAISHKTTALHLINEYLGDSVKGVSDEAFDAVLRLLTFERYWGTEHTWKLHRKGLAQMIKKRGGRSTFSTNWRMEMRIQITSQLHTPVWNNPSFATSLLEIEENYERPHSDFINFFQDINTETPNYIQASYPSITRAINFLQCPTDSTQHDHNTENEDRLMSLFYIAIILRDSRNRDCDLSWLNDSLERTEDVWRDSVGSLRWLLLQGMGREERTERLESVAAMLKVCSWRRIEDRLLSVILGNERDGVEDEDMSG